MIPRNRGGRYSALEPALATPTGITLHPLLDTQGPLVSDPSHQRPFGGLRNSLGRENCPLSTPDPCAKPPPQDSWEDHDHVLFRAKSPVVPTMVKIEPTNIAYCGLLKVYSFMLEYPFYRMAFECRIVGTENSVLAEY